MSEIRRPVYTLGQRVWLYYGGWLRATVAEIWPNGTLIITPDDRLVLMHGPGIAVPPTHPSLKPMSTLDQLAEI